MDLCSHHIETSQLICRAKQLTGFYMMGTLVVKELMSFYSPEIIRKTMMNSGGIDLRKSALY